MVLKCNMRRQNNQLLSSDFSLHGETIKWGKCIEIQIKSLQVVSHVDGLIPDAKG